MSDLMLDVGLANELKMSFRRNDWTEEQIKKAAEGDFLAQVRRVLLGHAEIVTPDHVIDCDATPSIPDGLSILPDDEQLPNRVQGAFKWDKESQENALHLDKRQKGGEWIQGNKLRNKLRKALSNQPVLTANLLDYLLDKPHLIPEEWKGKAVFFWGTIYRDPDGDLFVRFLFWRGDRWNSSFDWLGSDWNDDRPAAVDAR